MSKMIKLWNYRWSILLLVIASVGLNANLVIAKTLPPPQPTPSLPSIAIIQQLNIKAKALSDIVAEQSQLIKNINAKITTNQQTENGLKQKLNTTMATLSVTKKSLISSIIAAYELSSGNNFVNIITSPNLQTAIDTQITFSNLTQAQQSAMKNILQLTKSIHRDMKKIQQTEFQNNLLLTQLQAANTIATIQLTQTQLRITQDALEIQNASITASQETNPTTPKPSSKGGAPNPPPPSTIPTPGPPVNSGPNVPFTINTNLTQPSYITLSNIKTFFQGTALEKDSQDFLNAEKTYHVSAIYLVADATLETGFGTSQIYLQKHNLFGFEAYDNSPLTSAMTFASDADCISYVAWYVSTEYLTPPGGLVPAYGSPVGAAPSVPTGLYYTQPTPAGMNVNYATDPTWAYKIAILGEELQMAGLA